MTNVAPRSESVARRSRTSDARDHIGLLLDVSRRYYLEGRTQAEISQDAMFSRATVSRLLSEAKERGIVQIRVGHPLERVVDAERALVRSLGLKQARVADPADVSSSQQEVARCAADLLIENSPENAVITVSNGMAVTATVDAMPRLVWPRSRVVQMIGSTGQSDRLLDSPETCRRMARKLGGSFHPLPAPLVVQDRATAAALVADNQLATTLELGARADLALLGVGAVREGHSGLILREHEDAAIAEDLRRTGAVAHVCGHHLSADGQHVRTGLCERTIAVSPERLREIPLTIGVAWGQRKVTALAAAIRGGFISALVTDLATAASLLHAAGC